MPSKAASLVAPSAGMRSLNTFLVFGVFNKQGMVLQICLARAWGEWLVKFECTWTRS
jgi:hypothetical protein